MTHQTRAEHSQTAIPIGNRKCFLSPLVRSVILGVFCCIWAEAAGYVLALQTPRLLDVDHGASSSPELHRRGGRKTPFLLMIQRDDACCVATSSKAT